ncbi:hypothetical protein ABZ208_11140 [Streptomyces sp. NPDC006208]|uniref:hypothetical protein n=1 Tax=Streptomyces sp. NPDC006208 TaxID=3156734 RepID=UPI0033B98CB4
MDIQHNRALQDAALGTPPPDPVTAPPGPDPDPAGSALTAVPAQAAGTPGAEAPGVTPESAASAQADPVPLADAPAGISGGRWWRRTAVVVAVAALLGAGGGGAVGYHVQADRKPTPLPALNQPGLGYPKKSLPAGKKPVPPAVAQDHKVKTDGDLRRLLVPKPAGARAADGPRQEGWLGQDGYALNFRSEDVMFDRLTEDGFRRAVASTWKTGAYGQTNVYLVQFHPGVTMGAAGHAGDQLRYMPTREGAGNEGHPIKGSRSGRYFVYDVRNKPGYLPLYQARAIAYRGDIMLDIHMADTRPISKKAIRTLAEQQLERL